MKRNDNVGGVLNEGFMKGTYLELGKINEQRDVSFFFFQIKGYKYISLEGTS